MSLRERDGLVARIRQIRRTAEASRAPAMPRRGSLEREAVAALEARITDLEHLLQGLQDSLRNLERA